ncbi:MAG: vancomycin high temperature exclusion protein [Anaerolineae bacterium]
MKQAWKILRRLLLELAALGLIGILGPPLVTTFFSWSHIYQVANTPSEPVAVVFGAGLTRTGEPTAILKDRVETGAQLYFAGKVEKLLMSGDNRTLEHNEPEAMRQYAIRLGVPSSAIVLDYAGRRTYDTCYRAKAIFGLGSALLVTQSFHLPRALFLCNALGLQAAGVQANNLRYWPPLLLIWNVREQLATLGAFMDVYVSRPLPVLGDPEPMFPQGS